MEEYLSTWPYFQVMFILRDNMQGRKTVGNLTLAASHIKSQLCHTPSQASTSQEITSQELSSDIFSLMNEENIDLVLASPLPANEQPVSFTHEPHASCSTSKRSIEQHSRSRSPSRSRSETPTGPGNKKSKTISVQQQLVNIEKDKMEWFKKSTEDDDDADRHFLLSLLPQMKSLPPKKLSELKLKYLTLLHEAAYAET